MVAGDRTRRLSTKNSVREKNSMAFSIYQASVPVYTRQLTALSAILDKAASYAAQRKIDTTALVQARLFPDMLPLANQVQLACSHAMRGAARLSGMEPAKLVERFQNSNHMHHSENAHFAGPSRGHLQSGFMESVV
jgi:hypothetical protein